MEQLADGVSVYELRQQLDDYLFKNGNADGTTELAVTDLTNRVIKLSLLEGRLLKASVIDVEHVMLALFRNYEVQNMEFIKPFIEAGIDYDRLYAHMAGSNRPRAGAAFTEGDDDEADGQGNPWSGSGAQGDSAQSGASSASDRKKGRRGDKSSGTPVLDKFGHDMTRAAEEGMLDPVVGRETEIERLAQVLSRRKKNNPVLIGEPGVGKSAIVEGLALRIVQRKVSRILFDKRVVSRDMAGSVAGTKYRG
ncbi:MAG: AAA family ATPase, partial [Muribaculaceae bacterium]|nr:AAA family ATPase [Muribaculaceae bacterium]